MAIFHALHQLVSPSKADKLKDIIALESLNCTLLAEIRGKGLRGRTKRSHLNLGRASQKWRLYFWIIINLETSLVSLEACVTWNYDYDLINITLNLEKLLLTWKTTIKFGFQVNCDATKLIVIFPDKLRCSYMFLSWKCFQVMFPK